MNTEQHLKMYHEAMRYMDNAARMLSEKGKEEDGHYENDKCVRAACNKAYSGLLLATECYLEMQGKPIVKKRDRFNVEHYKANLAAVDHEALQAFIAAYNVLYLDGYYDGVSGVNLLKSGFNAAFEIFDRIVPKVNNEK